MRVSQYIATEGERWDTIAEKAYGRGDLAKYIIAANPRVPITPRLIGGTVLEIPIIETNEVKTNSEKLPPWKK